MGTIQRSEDSNESSRAERLLIDPDTGRPINPMPQPGYYPGFSTLDQQPFWDEATRTVIRDRIETIPSRRFFTEDEADTMRAVYERVMPQDDRDQAHRIYIVERVDDRLFRDLIDGYRFEDMPTEQEAYQLGIKGIEAVAQHIGGTKFPELPLLQQDDVLWTLHAASPPAGQQFWDRVPADRFWLMLVQDALEAYYSHPYAWDEIGFGGPAYPRGYFRLEKGQPEPWEVDEQRYEWEAPASSSSDQYRPLGGRHHHSGQEGTH
ncbi:MAG: gluconate 2-dehydrogenase subunit 3 family protein [Chloroflexota bacterium]